MQDSQALYFDVYKQFLSHYHVARHATEAEKSYRTHVTMVRKKDGIRKSMSHCTRKAHNYEECQGS